MEEHRHQFSKEDWPFDEAENLAVFSTRQVMHENHSVNLVAHDKEGDWQFLCGTTNDSKDCMVVCLGCLYEKFPDLANLKDLEPGWQAYRESENDEWVIEHMTFELTEDEYIFPRKNSDGYEFEIIEEEEVEEYPFDLPSFPSETERSSTKVGDFVKLIFRYRDSVEQNGKTISSERMWVEIKEYGADCIVGRLDSSPNYTDLVKENAEICFHPKHIVQIWRG